MKHLNLRYRATFTNAKGKGDASKIVPRSEIGAIIQGLGKNIKTIVVCNGTQHMTTLTGNNIQELLAPEATEVA